MIKNRPFLKWAGGKFRLLSFLLPHFPKQKRLIEPFGGSGAVFINTDFSEYIIAESNPDLIKLYCILRESGPDFISFCRNLFTDDNNCQDTYYAMRSQFNHSKTPEERVSLFLYLNRHGYNGLCRYNQQGKFNVPFGKYIKPYFPYNEMLHFYHKSQKAQFLHQDFRTSFTLAKKGDVIYCDPPYVPLSSTASFTNYSGQEFLEEDQLELIFLAKKAQKKGCTVLISNHDAAFTQKYYTDCEIIKFNVRRNISCKTENGRAMVKEILAIFNP